MCRGRGRALGSPQVRFELGRYRTASGTQRTALCLDDPEIIWGFGHDTSLFAKLVLGCIDSYDSEKWRIFSHFSRSTRFSHFRTFFNPRWERPEKPTARTWEMQLHLRPRLPDKTRGQKNEELKLATWRKERLCGNDEGVGKE